MRSTGLAALRLILVVLAIMWTLPETAMAQWDPFPWKNMPRTPDGKIDMKAPPRRMADGHVDLSGFWMPDDNVKHLLNLAADMKPEDIPLTSAAKTVYQERIDTNG